MRLRGRLSLALVLAPLAACEAVTHALDFRVGPAPAAGLCNACPAAAELRHPPCPSADPSPDLGRTFVFAARRSRLGPAADGALPLPDLGLDLDCSARPGGLPVLCKPRSVAGWTEPSTGVDDALLTRVLAPARSSAPPGRAIDLDAAISDAFERGLYGVVVAIRQWNGRADDPSVEVTLRSSPGLSAGGSPAWAGGDVWAPYPDVDDDGVRRFALERASGYVSGGTLVVDARARGAAPLRFGPRGAAFELVVTGLALTGALRTDRLVALTLTGVIDQPSADAAAAALASSLGACAGGAAGPFLASLHPLIALAADMPFLPASSRADPCDGISFAWSLDAEPALVAGETSDGGAGGSASCP